MGDKITSVAELKRAVKARRNPYQRDDAIGTGNFELLKCLELIGELEAGIREWLYAIENCICDCVNYPHLEPCSECREGHINDGTASRAIAETLRRLLGNEESLKDYLARVEKSRLEKMGEGIG